MTKMAKNHILCATHIYIAHIREYFPSPISGPNTSVIIQMKAMKQYIHVVCFITLYWKDLFLRKLGNSIFI